MPYFLIQLLNFVLWLVAAGLCLASLYGPHEADMGHHDVYLVESAFYNALARTSWSMGLSYLVVACALGQGGTFNPLDVKTPSYMLTFQAESTGVSGFLRFEKP